MLVNLFLQPLDLRLEWRGDGFDNCIKRVCIQGEAYTFADDALHYVLETLLCRSWGGWKWAGRASVIVSRLYQRTNRIITFVAHFRPSDFAPNLIAIHKTLTK